MGFTLIVNMGIVILSTFGFVSTTYGGRLLELPDHFDNPLLAIGFGLTGLLATLIVLGFSSALCTVALVNVVVYLNFW